MVSRRQYGCVNGLLSIKRRSKLGARQKSFSRDPVSEARHALPSIDGAIGRFNKERSLSVAQGVFHLGVTRNGRTGPAGQTDKRLGRGDKHSFHSLDEIFSNRDFLLGRPRKRSLLACFGERITARRHPQAATREFFGKIRNDRIIRSNNEPDHPLRLAAFAGGDAAPQITA